MEKLVINGRMEFPSTAHFHKFHYGVQSNFPKSVVGFRGDEDIAEVLDEIVELGAQPDAINEFWVGIGFIGRSRCREEREQRSEEGLEREERFESVRRRRIGGNESEKNREVVDVKSGSEQLLAQDFEVC